MPTMVFEGEPFFGQDRIDLLLWRMQQQGLQTWGWAGANHGWTQRAASQPVEPISHPEDGTHLD